MFIGGEPGGQLVVRSEMVTSTTLRRPDSGRTDESVKQRRKSR